MIGQNHPIRIERRPEVLRRTGFSRSTLYLRINDGLFTPAINLGGRMVGWLEHEDTAILAAMAAGKSKPEIQQLVNALTEDRQKLMESFHE